MSNPKNAGTGLHAACGAEISEAHYWRNVARTVMAKTKGMTEVEKALKVLAARDAMTQALLATPEGSALLMDGLELVRVQNIRESLNIKQMNAEKFGQAMVEAL